MDTATIGWFFAGIFFVGFVILWFSVSYNELSAKYRILEDMREQVEIHRKLFMQERGGISDAAAQNVLSGKLIAYNEMEKAYNTLLKQTINIIPGFLMGFRHVGKG